MASDEYPEPRYASWGQRAHALLLDGLVIVAPFFLLAFVLLLVIGPDDNSATDDSAGYGALVGIVAMIVAPFYFTLMHGRPSGQTVGKRALKIAVRHASPASRRARPASRIPAPSSGSAPIVYCHRRRRRKNRRDQRVFRTPERADRDGPDLLRERLGLRSGVDDGAGGELVAACIAHLRHCAVVGMPHGRGCFAFDADELAGARLQDDVDLVSGGAIAVVVLRHRGSCPVDEPGDLHRDEVLE